jgi:hypothetical protein
MSSITATAVPGNGYIRVEVDWSDIVTASGTPRKAWVYRNQGGTLTALRDADPVLLSGGRAIIYDVEAPLDTSLTYRSTVPLNLNGDFEEGVADWLNTANVGTIGTVTQDFNYYLRGTGVASLKLAPNGSAQNRAVSEFIPVTAGVSYTAVANLMVPTPWSGGIGIAILWYNGTTFLSSFGAANDFWPSTGEWGSYTQTATAPATTTQARIALLIDGSARASNPVYADGAYLYRPGATTIDSSSATLASNGAGWWKDPLHPATMVKLLETLPANCVTSGTVYGGLASAVGRAADSSLSDVNGSDLPVSTWSTRKGPQSSLRVGTASIADRDAVVALHASGAPLLLQVPAKYNLPDQYHQYGDLDEGFLGPNQAKPWRMLQAGYSQVYAPVGPAEGVFGVRYMDINRWTTYLSAEASGGGTYDTYNRTAVDTWSATDTGLSYTLVGTAADFDINGSRGLMSVPAISTGREARLLAINLQDVRVRVGALAGPAPTGSGAVIQAVRLRWTGVNDYIECQFFRNVAGGVSLILRQLVANVQTVTSGTITVTGAANNQDIAVTIDAVGSSVKAWAWIAGTAKPVTPTASITATATVTGAVTVRTDTGASITSLPYVAQVEDLQVTNLAGATAQNTWWDLLQGEGHV